MAVADPTEGMRVLVRSGMHRGKEGVLIELEETRDGYVRVQFDTPQNGLLSLLYKLDELDPAGDPGAALTLDRLKPALLAQCDAAEALLHALRPSTAVPVMRGLITMVREALK